MREQRKDKVSGVGTLIEYTGLPHATSLINLLLDEVIFNTFW